MKHEKMMVAAARLHDKLNLIGMREAKLVNAMMDEIENLREDVKFYGEHADICTYSTLGEVCNGCRCDRKQK